MKDKLHEQLSALVDDELEEHEQALLLKQLAGDAELSSRLSRFQVISDTLQNHMPDMSSTGFHERVHAALADEPPVQQRSTLATLFKPAAGLALAASVAMVAVLSLQSVRQEGPGAVPAVASAPSRDNYIRTAANDAVQPEEPARLARNLDVYLVNHSEFAVSRGILPYMRLVGHDMNPGNKE